MEKWLLGDIAGIGDPADYFSSKHFFGIVSLFDFVDGCHLKAIFMVIDRIWNVTNEFLYFVLL